MKRFHPILSSAHLRPDKEPKWQSNIPAAMKRRAPRIWQMAYTATKRAIESCGEIQVRSIVAGTALGALDETRRYLDGTFKDGFGSPRNFIASVHNSMAGKLALQWHITGPNLTVCDGQNSLASACVAANLLTEDYFPCMILAVDENIDLLKQVHPHLAPECRTFLSPDWPDAAVVLIIDKPVQQPSPVSISAAAPRLIPKDAAPESVLCTLAQDTWSETGEILDLHQTSSSYIKSALTVCELLEAGNPTDTIIGSCSPASGCVAAVRVCM